jgi:hypothetical protein
MRRLIFAILTSLALLACGSPAKSSKSAPKPTPEAATEMAKQEKSSCNACGGGGYTTDPSQCEAGEACIGVTISVSGAPVTVASCQRRFKDNAGKEYSYACRKK